LLDGAKNNCQDDDDDDDDDCDFEDSDDVGNDDKGKLKPWTPPPPMVAKYVTKSRWRMVLVILV
jgi:hypothetical protein